MLQPAADTNFVLAGVARPGRRVGIADTRFLLMWLFAGHEKGGCFRIEPYETSLI
jgi:hypothetical protein